MHTCITGADFFAGKRVRTIEGIATDGKPTAVQAAFLDHFAFQCGYCTPGFVNQAQVLVETLARAPVAAGGGRGRHSQRRWTATSAAAPAMCATTRPCAS